MSQKINPLSNKLGVIKTWNYESSKYGRTFKNYIKLIQFQKQRFNYLNHTCMNYDLLIESVRIIEMIHHTFFNVSAMHLKKSYPFKEKKPLLDTIRYWSGSQALLTFYKSENIGSTALLINNYIVHLFLKKSYSPKKILQLIYNILRNQAVSAKIKYTINGIKIIRLKGFKLEISGCFESSRSQMAKMIKCNFGTTPLTKLNGYIDYSTNTIFTKFGSCGFKIWLFYEFK